MYHYFTFTNIHCLMRYTSILIFLIACIGFGCEKDVDNLIYIPQKVLKYIHPSDVLPDSTSYYRIDFIDSALVVQKGSFTYLSNRRYVVWLDSLKRPVQVRETLFTVQNPLYQTYFSVRYTATNAYIELHAKSSRRDYFITKIHLTPNFDIDTAKHTIIPTMVINQKAFKDVIVFPDNFGYFLYYSVATGSIIGWHEDAYRNSNGYYIPSQTYCFKQ